MPGSNLPGLSTLVYANGFTRNTINKCGEASLGFLHKERCTWPKKQVSRPKTHIYRPEICLFRVHFHPRYISGPRNTGSGVQSFLQRRPQALKPTSMVTHKNHSQRHLTNYNNGMRTFSPWDIFPNFKRLTGQASQ
jgi:hypothetical protein